METNEKVRARNERTNGQDQLDQDDTGHDMAGTEREM